MFFSLCPFSHFEIFICVFIPSCEILQYEYPCRSESIVWPLTDSQHETLTQPDHKQHLNRCEHMWESEDDTQSQVLNSPSMAPM